MFVLELLQGDCLEQPLKLLFFDVAGAVLCCLQRGACYPVMYVVCRAGFMCVRVVSLALFGQTLNAGSWCKE